MPFSRPNFVFTCFKHIERCADRVTGAAGPLFIGVAILLFVIGTLCFRMSRIVQCRPIIVILPNHLVDVILPTLPWPWLSTLPCFLIIINLFAHYYFACTVSPGYAGEAPQRAGRSFIWAKKRRAYSLSRANGVYWSSHLNITPASITTCTKCGKNKPEVRQDAVI